jgi:hypothetical protein
MALTFDDGVILIAAGEHIGGVVGPTPCELELSSSPWSLGGQNEGIVFSASPVSESRVIRGQARLRVSVGGQIYSSLSTDRRKTRTISELTNVLRREVEI